MTVCSDLQVPCSRGAQCNVSHHAVIQNSFLGGLLFPSLGSFHQLHPGRRNFMKRFLMKITPAAQASKGYVSGAAALARCSQRHFCPEQYTAAGTDWGHSAPAVELLMSNASVLSCCCLSWMETGMDSGWLSSLDEGSPPLSLNCRCLSTRDGDLAKYLRPDT